MWIGQPAYTKKTLEKFGMENAKSVATPNDVGAELVKAEDGEERVDQSVY